MAQACRQRHRLLRVQRCNVQHLMLFRTYPFAVQIGKNRVKIICKTGKTWKILIPNSFPTISHPCLYTYIYFLFNSIYFNNEFSIEIQYSPAFYTFSLLVFSSKMSKTCVFQHVFSWWTKTAQACRQRHRLFKVQRCNVQPLMLFPALLKPLEALPCSP